MKLIILLFFALLNLNADSSFNKINMNANFYIYQGEKKSDNMNFIYDISIYHNTKDEFTSKSYCFLASKKNMKLNFDNKSKYKICLNNKNKIFVYILNKSNRYTKSKDFDASINNISLKIKGNKHTCKKNANTYALLHTNINKCLKNINNKS
ncbi:hypothetical protein [Malaciobacter marinus]|uniref:Uncharacterized protein n=2 Tax=Malaciobacter marinus TaxID=505249 RepID=A0A347TJF5_9BACT|nr:MULTISPECIES: hypothetical protein [Malaciobacter]AXX86733.1 hypothetical protein AMRN_0982 [Malaciobacter marinus]PHO12945.1 hypothetical protein CPG38_05480 [Malaciobacter marinus]RYA23295.1 hypothetical protein CRU96_08500 [Malaciobacter halophilus]